MGNQSAFIAKLRLKRLDYLDRYATASKHRDRGSMTLFNEVIRDCEKMIKYLEAI